MWQIGALIKSYSALVAAVLRVSPVATWTMALLMSFATPSFAVAQCGGRWLTSPEQVLPGVNSEVRALAVMPNGDIVAGGSFRTAGGITTIGIARWDGVFWRSLGTELGGPVSPVVDALAVLPNGDLIAAGTFQLAGGVTANHIARWNGSTWVPLGQGLTSGFNPNGSRVSALAVLPNGDLVAGGNFGYVARWNGSTWASIGMGIDGPVYDLAIMPNGDLVAAGSFGAAGGVSARNIARWNGSSWAPLGSGVGGASEPVLSLLVLPNGHLVAGGTFTIAGGVASNRIAQWNGSEWSPLGSGVSVTPMSGAASVEALALLPSGDVVVCGNFSSAGGLVQNGVAVWTGSVWAGLGSGVKRAGKFGPTYAVTVLPNGDLVVGGNFDTAGGVTCYSISSWNGTDWRPLGGGLGGRAFPSVRALVPGPNGILAAGGEFVSASGRRSNSVAIWNGTSWAPVGSGITATDTGQVHALAFLPNGDLVAAGNFTTAGGVAANGIARWNGSSWAPVGSGMNGSVNALVTLANGDLIAGGQFTSAGGVAANGIARWNGTAWVPLGSGIQGSSGAFVSALAILPNGNVVACGEFRTAGGVTVSNIAVWNGSSWESLGSGLQGIPSNEPTSFGSNLAVLPNGHLVAAGAFTTAGGVAANRIARWNGSSWSALGSGLNSRVKSVVALSNGDVVAAGSFSNAGGIAANLIARWNGSAWSPLGLGLSGTAPRNTFPPDVSALAVLPNGELVAGGQFTMAGGVSSSFWARWTNTGIPWIARQPSASLTSANETVTLFATSASGYDFNGPVSFQWHRNGSPIANGPSGASLGGGTVLGASGSLPSPTTDPTATLTIVNAQPSDAGSYTVVFSNSCGSVTSLPAIVTIEAACQGDLNNDGLVDDADFSIFAVTYDVLDCAAPAMPAGCPADLNRDGLVNDDDFQVFVVAYEEVLCP